MYNVGMSLSSPLASQRSVATIRGIRLRSHRVFESLATGKCKSRQQKAPGLTYQKRENINRRVFFAVVN